METKPIEQRIYDGERARDVLENESFAWAYESIEQELTDAWKSSPVRDADGREKIFLSLQMLGKMRAALVYRLETGKLATLDLEHKRKLADRIKEALR